MVVHHCEKIGGSVWLVCSLKGDYYKVLIDDQILAELNLLKVKYDLWLKK